MNKEIMFFGQNWVKLIFLKNWGHIKKIWNLIAIEINNDKTNVFKNKSLTDLWLVIVFNIRNTKDRILAEVCDETFDGRRGEINLHHFTLKQQVEAKTLDCWKRFLLAKGQ